MDIKDVKKSIRTIFKRPKRDFFNLVYRYFLRQVRQIGRNRTLIKEIDGINYFLDLNQKVDSTIYYEGCWERITSNAITKLLKPGMIALDIGANIGCHTFTMAKIIGPSGKIIAFEPMKWAFKKLKINLQLNKFKNITIENIALSDKVEVKEVLFRSSWTVDDKPIEEANKPIPTQMLTIDEYVKNNKLERVDFIKIDVDGYEFKVLRGAIETLKTFKPIMVVEIGAYTLKLVGDKIEDLIDFLFSLGYKFYSETTFRAIPDAQTIIKSIPDLKTTTINVILRHNSR